MEINVTVFKVNALDKAYINVGPSLQTGVRGKAVQNYGMGEVVGDDCVMEDALYAVRDDDVIDFPHQKIVIQK